MKQPMLQQCDKQDSIRVFTRAYFLRLQDYVFFNKKKDQVAFMHSLQALPVSMVFRE
jgi:hypothetical protein